MTWNGLVQPTREILFHSSHAIFGRMKSAHGGLPNLGVVNGPLKTLGLAKFWSNFTGLAVSFS